MPQIRTKTRVIIVTDGDGMAQRAVELSGNRLGLRVISASAGNPTRLSGPEIAHLCHQAPWDPVLVMVDDRGRMKKGNGEMAIEALAARSDIEIIGVMAVASNTQGVRGAEVDVSVTAEGRLVRSAVDKEGRMVGTAVLEGDTVDVLDRLKIPTVVGIGDLGKMRGADYLVKGAPITERAIKEILERNGIIVKKE